MSIGSALSASSAISRRVTSAAITSVTVPKTSSVRDLKAFSSRYEVRGSVALDGGVVLGVSMVKSWLLNCHDERDAGFVTPHV